MKPPRFPFPLAVLLSGVLSSPLSAQGLPTGRPADTVSFRVDTCLTHQTIDNFGASDAWSMQCTDDLPEQTQQQVARWLFSSGCDSEGNPEGIALSLWRFNIGAGSAEQGDDAQINPATRTECFLSPDGTYDWNKQAAQRKFLRLARQYGVPYLLGFLNSPPVCYTKNGLATNTGRPVGTYNLREEHYGSYARFLVRVVQGLQQHDGVTLDYLSPVNEPDGHWNWLGPGQEGTPATKREVAALTRLLDRELGQAGLGTKIIIPEASDYRCLMDRHMTGPERGYQLQSFMSPDSADTYVACLPHLAPVLAAHSYWTNTPVPYMKQCRKALRDSVAKYGTGLWQSELCLMSNDQEIGGCEGQDRSMQTALYVARVIHHDLTMADARAWQWWRALIGNFKNGPLQRDGQRVVDSKLLWALGHYSRFVRPGAVRLDARRSDLPADPDSATDPYGLMCSAWRGADGRLVVVLINYARTPSVVSLEGLAAPGGWNVYRTSDQPDLSLALLGKVPGLSRMAIPARCITTFVSRP